MSEISKLRIDKWLWSARFYRTRSLAKQAVESGRVHVDGARIKVSKEIKPGMKISVRQGSATRMDEKEVEVLVLSDQRGPATAAQLLYRETDESVQRRENYQVAKSAAEVHFDEQKPSKKQRRAHNRWISDQQFD